MSTSNPEHWRNLFENWPDIINKKGHLITTQGESVPFVGFALSGGLLLLERDGPDSSGARKAIVAYSQISMIKLAHPGELAQFQPMGFRNP